MDNAFIISMLMEGLHRYGSRNPSLVKRVEEVLGENASRFLLELGSVSCSIILLSAITCRTRWKSMTPSFSM